MKKLLEKLIKESWWLADDVNEVVSRRDKLVSQTEKKLKDFQTYWDIERAHYMADDLLIQFIKDLWFDWVAKEREKIDKRYA